MRIEISSNGIKLTAVPDESELSKARVFYVYERFIKDTDQVFYIGKGKGDRFKQLDRRNFYFLKVKEHFDCDVRIVKEGLSEYEASVLEEEWFSQREKEGHILTNIAVPNGVGANDLPEKYEYMLPLL
ncbi:hypothetical protein P5G62_010150 [Neobacillus sp. 179-C4.2 HS]|uniref:GIY-YIG nuclease family protein n=1 Tax=Neobacillus driksii TaxID=3035913 RepID=A0ABV4YUE1_9BACI|nr:hypothetical protein [Neobacillus sp. 179.-C4.2 HS]MDP5195043.1 hypothetical protein [Neobacillus sp. 179.-C4.2 HS]